MGDQATGLPSGYDVRETAEGTGTATVPAAAATGQRTFTEGEAYALVADNVQRETAAKTAENDQLKRQNAELQAKLDTSEAAQATEKASRETAEKELKDLKEAGERQKAADERKDERVKKVRETAAHLGDDFYTPERTARWASMEDEQFDSYIAELADLSKDIPAGTGTGKEKETPVVPASGAPRETAAQGKPVATGDDKPKGLAGFGAAAGLTQQKVG